MKEHHSKNRINRGNVVWIFPYQPQFEAVPIPDYTQEEKEIVDILAKKIAELRKDNIIPFRSY